MSVVHSAINELGRQAHLGKRRKDAEPQFTMRLPLTVVIAETLLVSAAGQTCAVPQSSVREIFHANETEIRIADGIEMVSYRGGRLAHHPAGGAFPLENAVILE